MQIKERRGVAFDLSGRVAFVTGAAQGMGASHAQRLAEAGARVGCIDLDPRVEEVAERIRAAGGRACAHVADVSDWRAIDDAAKHLRDELGPAHIAVANAGIMMPPVPVEDTDIDLWTRVIDVDLTGAFLTSKAAIPQLRERDGGSLILISSGSGLAGHPYFGAYNAAKHGVIGLARTLANELARYDIRVNAVCPAWVDSPMLEDEAANLGISRDKAAELFASQHLIPRLVLPGDVSDAVLWLASDASSMVTGIALPVDGGHLERRTDELSLVGQAKATE